jgi:hypothetical protein
VSAFFAVLLLVASDASLQQFETFKMILEVTFVKIVHRPAGLALVGARLDLTTLAIAGLQLREDHYEGQAAGPQDFPALRYKALPILCEKEVEHVITIDRVKRSGR